MKSVLLALFLFLSGTTFADAEGLDSRFLLSALSKFIDASPLLDNTDNGTAEIDIPGWVESGQKEPMRFGVTFNSGSSRYLLESATFLLASAQSEPGFKGKAVLEVFVLEDEKDIPSGDPIYKKEFSDIEIPPRPEYRELSGLNMVLDSGRHYAVALYAPNKEKARIMGYQVPNVAPRSEMGFQVGDAIFGGGSGVWRKLLYPVIELKGWDIEAKETSETIRSSLIVVVFLVVLSCSAGYYVMRLIKRGR